MNQLEENIANSFRLAKSDIIHLQNTVAILAENQQRIMDLIGDTREKETQLYQRVKDLKPKKTAVHKRAKSKFVASKNGKKVHKPNCPFAKNIKPKGKIIFHSKTKALNEGFKACECAA
jgi:hypothetical protein